jgi:hypothetical protein
VRRAAAAAFAFVLAATFAPASAEWRPPELHAATAPQASVLAACAKAAGIAEPRWSQRRERWTYRNGERRLPVRVNVRGDDFRASIALGAAEYSAGRIDGVRWRADDNGIAHATLSDSQGDALDRLPQSIFPYETADLTLAGESERFGPAWVLVDRAPRDKPHWFYADRSTGAISHEITRDGGRTIVTTFDRFETVRGATRPRHWRVSDGDAADDLDVTVDAVEPQPVAASDVALPAPRHVFATASPPPNGAVALPTHFRGRTIFVDVALDRRPSEFVLDTGTAGIVLDRSIADDRHWPAILEHATVPRMSVGPLRASNVSTLAIPLRLGYGSLGGILGYDFFVGHVVHVDYEHERVEVLAPDAAEPFFHAPGAYVMEANFDEGMPLVRAGFGGSFGDRFALDTGSSQLYVLAPFERRFASEIAARWTPANFRGGLTTTDQVYLEGSISVAARLVAEFSLGPARFNDVIVGIEVPNGRRDAIDPALDGIVGTDQMRVFDWWFDYDGGRIAVRRNNLR